MHNILAEAFQFTASHTHPLYKRCSNDSLYLRSNEEIEDHFPLNSSEVPAMYHCTAVAQSCTSHTLNLDLIRVCTDKICNVLI
jgi:hypothetical protein